MKDKAEKADRTLMRLLPMGTRVLSLLLYMFVPANDPFSRKVSRLQVIFEFSLIVHFVSYFTDDERLCHLE